MKHGTGSEPLGQEGGGNNDQFMSGQKFKLPPIDIIPFDPRHSLFHRLTEFD
jgi:hypothetical protein